MSVRGRAAGTKEHSVGGHGSANLPLILLGPTHALTKAAQKKQNHADSRGP